jgi:hypothetical protein
MRFLTSLVIASTVAAAEGLRFDRVAFIALGVAMAVEVACTVWAAIVGKRSAAE